MNGVVYAGFGGHCDHPDYQGWVIGFTTGGQVSTLWTSEAGESGNPGAGIWQSGGGLVSDVPGEIVLTTGNGNVPSAATPGNAPPNQLGQAIVRLRVQPDQWLEAVDFFMPYDAEFLNSWDADFGSGGPVVLPSQEFGTDEHPRIGLQMGKQGYLYVLDETDLGGYRQGAGGSDDVLQRLGPFGGVWSKPGVWPGDGGYVYVTTASAGNTAAGTTGLLNAFKYGLDGNGDPTFSLVGTSPDAFGFSSGSPVISSNNTQSGSALVWVVWSPDGSGNNSQLRAYDPIPVDGSLNLRWSAPIGQVGQVQRAGHQRQSSDPRDTRRQDQELRLAHHRAARRAVAELPRHHHRSEHGADGHAHRQLRPGRERRSAATARSSRSGSPSPATAGTL